MEGVEERTVQKRWKKQGTVFEATLSISAKGWKARKKAYQKGVGEESCRGREWKWERQGNEVLVVGKTCRERKRKNKQDSN